MTGLLRRTTFNMAVGNADAHAKNFSVLHEPGVPAVRLASLYDVLSTIALELTGSAGQPMRVDTHLGQRVGGQPDIRTVTAASLIDEAATWGIRRRTASVLVTDWTRCLPPFRRHQAMPGSSPSFASRPSGSAEADDAGRLLYLVRDCLIAPPSAVRSGITLRSLGGKPGCEPGLIPIDGSRSRRQS